MTLPATLLTWLLLLLLLGIEFAASRFAGGSLAAPLIGIAMAVLVAMTFMNLASAPSLGVVFVLAGLFWLAVLMGLGRLDTATRHDVPISMRTSP